MRGKDLTDTYVEDIYIKCLDENKRHYGGHAKYWICVCPICKKEFSVRQNHLTCKTPIKMCDACNKTKRENLIGKKFGHLTVIKMLPYEKYKRTKCECTCDCGSTNIIVQANHLKAGEIQSCGCLISRGEEYIAKLLEEKGIIYERQKCFLDCFDISYLRFDFFLPNLNIVIEYNGIQHYQPVELFGGEKSLQYTQLHDKMKEDYCKKNNIQYISISYNDNIIEILSKNHII